MKSLALEATPDNSPGSRSVLLRVTTFPLAGLFQCRGQRRRSAQGDGTNGVIALGPQSAVSITSRPVDRGRHSLPRLVGEIHAPSASRA